MNAVHPFPDASEVTFFDPEKFAEHLEWAAQRYRAHVMDALTFHRLARRHLRRGMIGLARDNYRCGLRHIRMAKHFRKDSA